ncbi:hypothetical protein AAA799B03_00184 [Marine Group I thaumarchaeote SCGC AAA799-B03]|uniref:DUF998 domain-containing protein n=1 Tax=Marine Group I thaumarchaeote SCGC AAA799-B03 TaxID=1502289 RepID=A0A087S8V8_9ARCH|nr:hypothetical protein AAA799B03_00184 [Marine Group I thaumarchaeote SCGC AAA799-B03]
MRLIQRISNSTLVKSNTLIHIICILSVIGPVITVSAGFWDTISHLQKEPEFFWSPSHMIVYTGVSMITFAAVLGGILIIRKSVNSTLKTGIKLVMIGSVIQLISGFGDSLSHEVFGIDGLVSWSHQPLEMGLVLGSLGGLLILKNREHTKLKILLPFSIVTFLFFTMWLGFNMVLIFGHTIQCIPVYEIFSSGCAIL